MNLSECLVAWRTITLPDREVVDALVHPLHAAPSPALAGVLAQWPGTYYWSEEREGRHLVLTRPLRRRRERWALHAALFLATLYTITFAGAVLANGIPYTGLLEFFTNGYPGYPGFLSAWVTGLPFSLPLLAILTCHELGHYLVARRYQLDVSPPYFIPAPVFPTFIGTLGAFIRLRTVLSDRRQLFDVGVAGPLAGFIIALPVFALGLVASGGDHGAFHAGIPGLTVYLTPGQPTPLGDSIVTLLVRWLLLGRAAAVSVTPLAFAGWLGMFVTMLNLLPLAQLDGGHILFATLPRWYPRLAIVLWCGIIALGRWWWGWYLWGVLVLLVSRGRLAHPPVLDTERPLPTSRRAVAWAALVLFLITFTPAPFQLG